MCVRRKEGMNRGADRGNYGKTFVNFETNRGEAVRASPKKCHRLEQSRKLQEPGGDVLKIEMQASFGEETAGGRGKD